VARRRKATEWERAMSERLQRLRQRAGLSQSQLARAAGIPIRTLQEWEQARRSPGLEAAGRIADALGCTLDELAGRKPQRGQK
jgi:transcriptional regulator with XRE-family HTH domain